MIVLIALRPIFQEVVEDVSARIRRVLIELLHGHR